MKISQDMRTQLDSLKKGENQRRSNSHQFDNLVRAQSTQLKQAELTKLMSEITAQGLKIARFRSFKDLAAYKRMVKRFLKETVDFGLGIKQTHSFVLDGDNRKLSIVQEIDEKLVELTENVLDQEKNSIQILDLIGEIKGLLINLYT
ncbi:YaaR family protein [Gracilibacillus oryzae]|uniref:YaaR family protein n=1 Tax=Gracilibacillus oryzae TaxID=1672701 RepID=A0A7C8GRH7_9BACI|nr:YaaR family protein [Gracilibacillus oryzae]KAB8126538.1 YaaR family protein [Gracilibacillus oryzae]